jgi:hypothetical protein
MKSSFYVLASLTLFIYSLADSTAGGVTVGNGQGSIIVGLSIEGNFYSEENLTNFASDIIQDIHKGDHLRINHMKAVGRCNQDFGQVKALDFNKFYDMEEDQLNLRKQYFGYMQIELKNCKDIEAIEADEPHGGEALWEIDRDF